MSITVVIPSRQRPDFLKIALESVKRQTMLQSIDKIIVSENSYDDASKYICKQFTELNIEYIQQPKEITAVEHLTWIIQQSGSTYTAMLHDDDWWYPTHLESALMALENNNFVSYFSNFILTQNELCKAAFLHHPSMISYVLGERPTFNLISLTLEDVAALCYLYTPFHMSSMVAVTSCLKEANTKGLKYAKPGYADRIIYPYLGINGALAFNPQILCGARLHERNDGKTIPATERISTHIEGSEKIKHLALSKGIDILKKWENIRSTVKDSEWDEIRYLYKANFGESDKSIFSFEVLPDQSILRKVIKNILPHGMVLNSHKLLKWK